MSTEVTLPEGLLDVRSGEVLPATPENAVELVVAMNERIAFLNQLINDCKYVLEEAFGREGWQKSSEVGGRKVVFRGGPKSVPGWDIEVLELLRDLGLPEERWNDLVVTKVITDVKANVAKQIAGANPEYAKVIEAARTYSDRAWTVTVT